MSAITISLLCFLTTMKLNQLLTTWALLLLWLWVNAQGIEKKAAQDTVTTLQKEPSLENDLRLTHLYAWSYTIGTVDKQTIEEWTTNTFWNFRAWGRAVWNISDKVSANGLLAYDQSTGEGWKMINFFWVNYTLTSSTKISIGKWANAAMQMVELPVTPWGQLLLTAAQQAVAPWVGVKVNQKVGDMTFSWSGMLRPEGVETSLYFNEWGFSVAAVLDPATKRINGGASFTGDLTNGASIFSMVRLKPELLSLSAAYTTQSNIGMFVDSKYDRESNKWNHFFIWVLKSVQQGDVHAKIWGGFDIVKNNFQAIVFITLGGERK